MKRPGFAINALLILTMATAVAAESTRNIDMSSDDTDQGLTITYCSKPAAANSSKGDAYLVFEKNDKIELAFGMLVVKGVASFGTITQEQVAASRGATDPEGEALIVNVDKMQYDEAIKSVGNFAKQDEFPNAPAIEILNVVGPTLKPLGLKAPYRSGLSGAGPMRYFGDLGILNRKGKKRKPSQ